MNSIIDNVWFMDQGPWSVICAIGMFVLLYNYTKLLYIHGHTVLLYIHGHLCDRDVCIVIYTKEIMPIY